MTKIAVFVWLGIMLASCEKKQGFFSEMPKNYNGDSLGALAGVFNGLKTTPFLDGNGLAVDSEDCDLIPFCGDLVYRNDSVFYSNKDDHIQKLFFVLGDSIFSKRIVNYTSGRSDEVTYLGPVFDLKLKDSVYRVKLEPIKSSMPPDTGYLKYLVLKKGRICYLTFGAHYGVDVTVELSKVPSIIYYKE